MAGAGESDTDESISLSRHIRFLVQRDLNEARLESKKKLQKYEKKWVFKAAHGNENFQEKGKLEKWH